MRVCTKGWLDIDNLSLFLFRNNSRKIVRPLINEMQMHSSKNESRIISHHIRKIVSNLRSIDSSPREEVYEIFKIIQFHLRFIYDRFRLRFEAGILSH